MRITRDSGAGHSADELLSAGAREVYLSIVRSGGRAKTREHQAAEKQIQELLDFGLLIHDTDDHSDVVAVDPRALSISLSSSWQREAAQLLHRSVALSADLRDLGDAFSELSGQTEASSKIEYVHGYQSINQRLAMLVDSCTHELMTAQPGGGRSAEALRSAFDRDRGVLRRGGTTRSIYQPSARYSSPTLEYVETMTAAGSQIRTLGEPFSIMIIADRKTAVIPGSEDMTQAAFVKDHAVVAYLIQLFESLWERAIPFHANREIPPQVLSSLRRQIVRFMAQGIGHRVIARNLGLSERTLARHIAEMREDYGVDTLFQLGWKLAQEPDQSIISASEELSAEA
ncbi:helix-turn-helix domain-containing protein [Kitasatospora sp. NPDC057198]|uniref:helix-turn-helix domain-containing protein n=1 Tax=Kitasatospora sp. NPDC057198 TaxID=3346046 RepID=UPI003633A278